MSGKLLTVIVPSYNMEEYLPKCLGSLIVPDEAMLQRLDVIVINDGSKDRTSEIAHDFEKRYPGIFRVIDKENGNYGSCINVALPVAEGFYVKVLDADDSFDTSAFSRFLSFIKAESNERPPDVIINDFIVVDGDGNETKRNIFGADRDTSFSISRDIDYHAGKYMWMHAVTYRTNLVQSIGYRQTEGISYTDQEWITIPMMFAKAFRRFPEPVYRYLIGRDGQTVEPSVRLRNLAARFSSQKKIIEAWLNVRNTIQPNNSHFIQQMTEGFIQVLYSEYLVLHPNVLNLSDLEDFDAWLEKKAPSIYEYANQIWTKACRFTPPFFFVKVWRRHYSRRSILFFLYDIVTAIRQRCFSR